MTLPPGLARLVINPVPTGLLTVYHDDRDRRGRGVWPQSLPGIEVTTMAFTGRPDQLDRQVCQPLNPPLREAILDGEVPCLPCIRALGALHEIL